MEENLTEEERIAKAVEFATAKRPRRAAFQAGRKDANTARVFLILAERLGRRPTHEELGIALGVGRATAAARANGAIKRGALTP